MRMAVDDSGQRAVYDNPREIRSLARMDRWARTTAGQCAGYQQANVVIVPSDIAADFASFCTRNPRPCPLIEVLPPGEPFPRSAIGADIRTDVGHYRMYRNGELVDRIDSLGSVWRDDLVTFLLGCSHTFEHALDEAGVVLRHVQAGTTVPMFVSTLRCIPAGRFSGPVVVTHRPIPANQLALVLELSARYPHAHGVPVHIGDPEAIGIADLNSPDYGQPVATSPDDVAVFWACGV